MTSQEIAAIVAIVLGLLGAFATAAMKVYQWISTQVETTRAKAEQSAKEREAFLMAWQETQNHEWQNYMAAQRADELKALADLAKSVDGVTSSTKEYNAMVKKNLDELRKAVGRLPTQPRRPQGGAQ